MGAEDFLNTRYFRQSGNSVGRPKSAMISSRTSKHYTSTRRVRPVQISLQFLASLLLKKLTLQSLCALCSIGLAITFASDHNFSAHECTSCHLFGFHEVSFGGSNRLAKGGVREQDKHLGL
jgi:exopolyphosphatase/pppGpp-phosphohydrolase